MNERGAGPEATVVSLMDALAGAVERAREDRRAGEPTLHKLTGGYVVVRTAEPDPDNGWDAAVVVCASLDSKAYATPEVARAIAADLLAAADAVAPRSDSQDESYALNPHMEDVIRASEFDSRGQEAGS